MKTRPSVVVTGVSSGIGLGITEFLTAKGVRVFGSVRRCRDADRITERFEGQVVPLIFDTTDPDAVQAASTYVEQILEGETLLGLVNNAGIGTAAPLLHVPLSEFRQQLEVNVIGTLNVIQRFTPLLKGPAAGRIVNIGSTAGRIGIPFFGAYSASKHALNGMSESLRRELLLYGIDVITVVPGAVRTAIWDKAEELDLGAYKATPYGPLIERFRKGMVRDGRDGMEPEIIGEAVYLALTGKQPSTAYLRIAKRLENWTAPTTLPSRWVDKLIGAKLGLKLLPCSKTHSEARSSHRFEGSSTVEPCRRD